MKLHTFRGLKFRRIEYAWIDFERDRLINLFKFGEQHNFKIRIGLFRQLLPRVEEYRLVPYPFIFFGYFNSRHHGHTRLLREATPCIKVRQVIRLLVLCSNNLSIIIHSFVRSFTISSVRSFTSNGWFICVSFIRWLKMKSPISIDI